MDTAVHNNPPERRIKKKRVRVNEPARGARAEHDSKVNILLACCVIVLVLTLFLYLAMPLLTRQQVVTVDLNGRISITDTPAKYTRVLE